MTEPYNGNNNGNPASPSLNEKVPRKAWMSLAILGSALLIAMYGETMLLPAIPDIIEEFDISYNTSSWILSAYLIAGAVATPLGGKLSDIYGRKKMVIIILIIYIIGITLGGLSTNIAFLIVARVIQGIGISMFPIAFGIIRDQFPKDKLAIGVGVFELYVRGWFCDWFSIGSKHNREFWLANYVFFNCICCHRIMVYHKEIYS